MDLGVLGVDRPSPNVAEGIPPTSRQRTEKIDELSSMARFILEGSTDPFLRVDLTQGT